MRGKTRKIISFLLCVLLSLNSLGIGAFATTDTVGETADITEQLSDLLEETSNDVDNGEKAEAVDSGDASAKEAEVAEKSSMASVESKTQEEASQEDPEPTDPANNEFNYILVNETFEYGQDTVAVIIDTGEDGMSDDLKVDANTVDTSTFNIYSTTRNASNNSIVSDNIQRNITNAYVKDEATLGATGASSGRYIILELESGYGVAGAPAFNSSGPLVLDYTIIHQKFIAFVNGSVCTPKSIDFNYADNVNLIVDDFTFEVYEGTDLNTPYRQFTPATTDAPCPLVLWLHGGGEGGTNNESQMRANMGAVAWASPENQAKHPCYVLAPQTTSGWSAADFDNITAVINSLIGEGKVDANRVYVAGCSMGGGGTLRILDAYPHTFAAAIPICPAGALTEESAVRIKNIPLWLATATNDPVISPETVRDKVDLLRSSGATVQYTEYPNVDPYFGHFSWVPVLNNDYSDEYGSTFMDWLFAQNKIEPVKTSFSYTLINEVFEYGTDTSAVIIDMRAAVDVNYVDADSFDIYSTTTRPSDGVVLSDNILRNATNVYVKDEATLGDTGATSGRYIVLELECGSTVPGACAFYSAFFTSTPLALSYEIVQKKNVIFTDSTVYAPSSTVFTQRGLSEPILDQFTYEDSNGTQYRLFTPETETNQPLVLWLHGGGEGGTNNENQMRANMGGVAWASPENQAKNPCYVMAPQADTFWPSTSFQDYNNIVDAIGQLVTDGKVDPNRIYVSGCSMGGLATLTILERYPQLFAAAIPICPAIAVSQEKAETIKDIPMWFVHAANDPTISVEQTRASVDLLRSLDSNVRYSEYENVDPYNGHFSWVPVLNNKVGPGYEETYIDWLFARSKDEPGKNEYAYTLVNETFEYGQDTIAVIIDMKQTVDANYVKTDSFDIFSTTYSARNGAAVSENVRRNVTKAYVKDEAYAGDIGAASGRYIVLEMEVGFGMAGAAAFGSGGPYRLDYTVTPLKNIVFFDGSVASRADSKYVYKNNVSLIADEFSYELYNGDTVDTPYRMFKPETVEGEVYPLVVWIHGGGESGTNNENQMRANMGATVWATPEVQNENPCYVIAPQSNNRWSEAEANNVAAIIEELIATGQVDPDRVYISGCSMGGAGTLRILYQRPDLIAAGIPICPANSNFAMDEEQGRVIAQSGIPLWFVQASNDPTVSASGTRGKVSLLADQGANVRYTEFANVGDYNGHWSWVHVTNNEYVSAYNTDFMTWLFAQSKNADSSTWIPHDFQLVKHVFEYGQDVTKVAIDMGTTVNALDIDSDTFTVTAVNKPLTATETNTIYYSGGRKVVNAYVSASPTGEPSVSGQFIVLELEVGYGLFGAASHQSGDPSSLNYTVQQNKDIAGVANTEESHYNQAGEFDPVIDQFTYENTDSTPYRLFTPENNANQPLVLWMHGAGESGTNNERPIIANMGGAAWAAPENQANHPSYVMAPQTNTGWSATDFENIATVINQMIADGKVDPSRVYIAGCSMGGGGTLGMLIAHPELFAAAIPICPFFNNLTEDNARTIKDIPMWFATAANDPLITVGSVNDKVNLLRSVGASVLYTVYPNVNPYFGHFSWVPVLNNDYSDEYGTTYMDWLFAQSRSNIDTFIINASVNGEGGSISPSGEVNVSRGQTQDFTISAETGYQIDQVLVDGSNVTLTSDTYSFTNVTENHSIAVSFKQSSATEKYTVTASANTGGNVPATTEVEVDGNANISVAAEKGYKLIAIIVDGVSVNLSDVTDGVFTLENVTADHNVRALYVTDQDKDFAADFIDIRKTTSTGAQTWYYNSVDMLAGLGIINGITSTRFAPETNVKRSEFTKMLFELATSLGLDVEQVTDIPFTDMPSKGYWAIGYIGWAYENELVEGYNSANTIFGPEREITREEMAVMMQRFFKEYAKYDLPGETTITFSDAGVISNWAKDAVEYAVRTGLMAGSDGKFAPKDYTRRSEAAQVFYNYLIF